MMNLRLAVGFGFLLVALVRAHGQSINLDLDVGSGPPEDGNGAPSSSFGAAANQLGMWNRINAGDRGPDSLFGLDGLPTGVLMSATNTGAYGGSGWRGNTGDYRALLNDYAEIPGHMTYTFSGLTPGAYSFYTYAANALPMAWPVHVSVSGSTDPMETVTDPMTGNAFAYLVTHSIHYVPNVNGDVVISLDSVWPHGEVNGFQIVAVPEPSSLVVVGVAALFVGRRRTLR